MKHLNRRLPSRHGGAVRAAVCILWLIVGGCAREEPSERLALSRLSAVIDSSGVLSIRLSNGSREFGAVGGGSPADTAKSRTAGVSGWIEFLKSLESVPANLDLDVHEQRDWWADVEPVVAAFGKLRLADAVAIVSGCGPARAVIRVRLSGSGPGPEWSLPVSLLEERFVPSISSASPIVSLSAVSDGAGVTMLQYRQHRAIPSNDGEWRPLVDAIARAARNDRFVLGLTLERTISPSGAPIHLPVALVVQLMRDLEEKRATCEFQFIDLFGWY